MRLSATDRIIREAAQHDDAAVEAAEHPDTEKVSAAPFVALGIPAPRMPTPLSGGVDIDLDSDGDDGHDDEGETQVDAQRSAAALKEMRALQPAHFTPAPTLTGRADQVRQRGVPPGRPAGIALVRAFAPPPPDVQVDIDLDDNRSDQLFSSSRIPFGADTQPAGDVAASGTSWPSHRTARVSRRTGVAIAASTALAVALIAGAWTTKKPVPDSAAIPAPPPVLPSSLRPGENAPTPPRPNGPVVVATAPPPAPAQAAPETAEAPPSPAMPEEFAPTTGQAAQQAPWPATAPTPSAPLSKRAQAAGASAAKKSALKARVAKKRAALAAASAKRRARAHKSSKAVATSAAPSRPTASRSADTSRGRGDPDDTLPITD